MSLTGADIAHEIESLKVKSDVLTRQLDESQDEIAALKDKLATSECRVTELRQQLNIALAPANKNAHREQRRDEVTGSLDTQEDELAPTPGTFAVSHESFGMDRDVEKPDAGPFDVRRVARRSFNHNVDCEQRVAVLSDVGLEHPSSDVARKPTAVSFDGEPAIVSSDVACDGGKLDAVLSKIDANDRKSSDESHDGDAPAAVPTYVARDDERVSPVLFDLGANDRKPSHVSHDSGEPVATSSDGAHDGGKLDVVLCGSEADDQKLSHMDRDGEEPASVLSDVTLGGAKPDVAPSAAWQDGGDHNLAPSHAGHGDREPAGASSEKILAVPLEASFDGGKPVTSADESKAASGKAAPKTNPKTTPKDGTKARKKALLKSIIEKHKKKCAKYSPAPSHDPLEHAPTPEVVDSHVDCLEQPNQVKTHIEKSATHGAVEAVTSLESLFQNDTGPTSRASRSHLGCIALADASPAERCAHPSSTAADLTAIQIEGSSDFPFGAPQESDQSKPPFYQTKVPWPNPLGSGARFTAAMSLPLQQLIKVA
eukprot:Blabericola_migrator_1__2796@NODE_17_length_22983_cov_74_609923_g14_i0_p6_GENE_NODE_17_length_22983_cov_74_609923_g14_i0NODE_17_length_22983_cov_74_609923_g14_i0_p6_ORF_typecomplete_len541_score101_40MAD/PF05557_13/0_022Cast/PF10174_9/0_04Golgin_A5/PF09787_9/0_047DUF3450/PF11932_8/0_049Atg14/PF10186_9/0_077MT/PF12777_7/0_083PspA_IM30/PF04012_12/0_088MCCbdg_PDZ/PF10506_9/0_12WEMBL/PF05701_11/0_11HMMR_N/PF15905_5/0_15GAS/PF13851_6/0_19DUF3498/PF12004_8/0_34TPD52/PF04201_15/0_4ADIP/PF11559_8/0_44Za